MQNKESKTLRMLNISPITKIYFFCQFLIRTALLCYAYMHDQTQGTVGCFIIGLLFDFLVLCYALPLCELISALCYWILPLKSFRYLLYVMHTLLCMLLLALAIGELGFWDEFSTRFNFIAVDYLVYTREVMGILKTALPAPLSVMVCMICIMSIIAISSCDFTSYLRRYTISNKVIVICITLVIDVFAFYKIDSSKITLFAYQNNKYHQELSKNGVYELFRAFFQNSLNYYDFYLALDSARVTRIARYTMEAENASFLDDIHLKREVNNNLVTNQHLVIDEQKIGQANVVIVLVESLSAEFLGFFGNNKGLTPYLDAIIKNSIVFKNFYATGTRTVRGIEAITLSTPPLPGSAIVRRHDNHDLENNVSKIFQHLGYDVSFIYGGYSYFDNMLNYFRGNGYSVIDRLDIPSSDVQSENIWGVADEHTFAKAIQTFDQIYSRDKHFFSIILTTSNHRPFTFPENRIDLPQGSRDAAVKYTDYAIGKFLEDAAHKGWFDNTIFVIVADHCASSAGKTDLPVEKYHIPMIIYAPKLLKHKVIENLASQIDLAPTLLGLMKINYVSSFFGSDIVNFPKNRAFISTYQLLGMMNLSNLAILYPGKRSAIRKLDELLEFNNREYIKQNIGECSDDNLEHETISFYQSAYDLFYGR